ISLSVSGYSFTYYDRWQQVPAEYWDLAQIGGDRFLQREYLSFLEEYPPANMEFGYILFRKQGRGIGLAYFQLLDFQGQEHIRSTEAAASKLRNAVSKHLQFRLLVCGNMLLTGPHAYFFLPE